MNGGDRKAIVDELNRTRDELVLSRRKHDEEVTGKLKTLEVGQDRIFVKISEIELSYVSLTKLEAIEKRVSFHDRVIWIAIGAVGLIKVLEPLISHFLK